MSQVTPERMIALIKRTGSQRRSPPPPPSPPQPRKRLRGLLKLLFAVVAIVVIADKITDHRSWRPGVDGPMPALPPEDLAQFTKAVEWNAKAHPEIEADRSPPKSEIDVLRERCDELTADKNLRFGIYQTVTGWGQNPNACGSGPTATDIELICPLNTGDGYRVTCNHARYVYDVVDYGGRWVVKYLPPTSPGRR